MGSSLMQITDAQESPSRTSGSLLARLPGFRQALERMPPRNRPALFYESLANYGTGAFLTMFAITLVVLQTILHAELWCLALLATMFFGSSLISPLVTWVGRRVPMRLLVIIPNALVAGLLLLTLLPQSGPLLLTLVVGSSFLIRAFPRVAEMNMFRVLYPVTHRSTAIGWTRAVSAISGLSITLLSWWWFSAYPQHYEWLYCLVAALMLFASVCYSRIPVSRRNMFARNDPISPWRAFRSGFSAFVADRRFMQYQLGFAIAGIANHMALMLIPKVLDDRVQASPATVGFITAVFPTMMIIGSSPLWGRFLDRRNPMVGRCIFNMLQCGAFVFYAIGGLTMQTWPFFLGTALHGISNGGGMINWLTGSMYFARQDQVPLYNGIHVCLTGVRGFIGPAVGYLLFIGPTSVGGETITGMGLGPWVFAVSAVLSLAGGMFMLYLHATDTGPREVIAQPA